MLAGVALVAVAGLVLWRARPAPDVGVPAARELATTPPAAVGPAPAVPMADGAVPTAATTVAPERLAIPALGLTARVVPVGVRGDELDVPSDGGVVGWYRFGPGLDAPAGSMVIAGHVDTVERGRGAFFRLRELTPGARIELAGGDGRVRPYRVVAREEYRKSAVPLERFFARDGATRVALVTCGGPFDEKTRHYRDNVVVTAEPV